MALMAWSNYFITGIDSIDAQHRGLVDLINAAAPHLAEVGEAPARHIKPLLDRLAKYAVLHFQHEEGVMLAGGLDPVYREHHKRSHDEFTAQVTQMIRDASTDNNVSGGDLLRFLTSWLTFHILAEDQCMVGQLRAIKAGMSSESTPAAERRNEHSVNGVLLGALIDLFSLVSKRNLTLKALNQELHLAKGELALANEQLEARVAERTAELEKANEDLGRERKALIESLALGKHTQAQLIQAEKMAAIGQLAAGVAHEINSPIGFITSNFGSLTNYTERLFTLIGAFEQIESALPVEHPSRLAVCRARELAELDYLRRDIPELLRESSEGLARVKRIVTDLMDSSHVEATDWQEVDLNQVLERTVNLLARELTAKADITKDLRALPPVRCIPLQINQVFINLLLNATQAIETSGVISLRSRVDGANVRIDITDTGAGFPDAVRKRIFEPFFTTKPVGQGTGLGLSTSWEIVKRHTGRIDVSSKPGSGSTFTIVLPISTPSVNAKGAEA